MDEQDKDEQPAAKKTALERISKDPSTNHALNLFHAFAQKSFDRASLTQFLDSLPAHVADERKKIEALIDDSSMKFDADLSDRSHQLAWAAGLAYLFINEPKGAIRQHPIWSTLLRNKRLGQSLSAAARYIDLSVSNPDVTMSWGTPGSWFWFASDKNHINIDLFHTLLCGFSDDNAPGFEGLAHSIAIMMHEIGHSQLTVKFSDEMQALKTREDALFATGQANKGFTDEQKLELAQVQIEFALRMNLMNAAEDNCVNRYAANVGREFPHNFSESLNIVNMILQGSGSFLRGNKTTDPEKTKIQEMLDKAFANPNDQKVKDARKALDDLNRAIALSFYTTNGLFPSRDYKTWEALGINPQEIQKGAAYRDKASEKTPYKDFNDLLSMNVGYSGIANMQPARYEAWALKSVFQEKVEGYAERRNAMIDRIWDEYAAHHAQILIDQAEQLLNQEPPNGPPGDEPSQEQGEDDPSPSQGNDFQNSQEPQQSEDGDQNKQDGDENKDSQSQENQSGDSSQNQNSGENPDQNQQNAGDNQSQSESQESEPERLPSSPEEMRQSMRDEDEASADMDQSVDDLMQQSADGDSAEQNSQDGNGQDSGGGGNSPGAGQTPGGSMDMGQPSNKGGLQKGTDLSKLAKRSWTDFRQRLNELEVVIDRIAQDFIYIREQQKQSTHSISKRREELPRGGELQKRLDMKAHMDYAVKVKTGQKIEDEDRRRWRKDDVDSQPTSVELWILGDGSGSMSWALPKGGRRIDSAVQSMAILYEAGRRAEFETFVGMWGDQDIRMVAAPGDSDQKIGQNFEKIRDGINSGTVLSPAFAQAVDHSSKQELDSKGRQKTLAGMTHFLILSDGELNGQDIEPLANNILRLFEYGPDVTIDIAILAEETPQASSSTVDPSFYPQQTGGRQMVDVVNRVKAKNPAAKIDVIFAEDPKTIPLMLAAKIKQRFEHGSKTYNATPDRHKREAFSRAYTAMKKK